MTTGYYIIVKYILYDFATDRQVSNTCKMEVITEKISITKTKKGIGNGTEIDTMSSYKPVTLSTHVFMCQ